MSEKAYVYFGNATTETSVLLVRGPHLSEALADQGSIDLAFRLAFEGESCFPVDPDTHGIRVWEGVPTRDTLNWCWDYSDSYWREPTILELLELVNPTV